MAIDEVGCSIYKRFEKMIGDRGNWTTHWDEVSNYIVPRKDNLYGIQVRGEKKINHLYDTSAIMSNEFLAAALHGMLTNPATMWFGLSTGIDELDNEDETQKWIQETVKIMINTLNQSNFQTEIHEVYIDLGSFGTSVLRVEEDDELDIRFHARPIYEFTIEENSKGDVDTTFYEYELTVRQLVELYGEEVLDDDLRKKLQEDPSWREKVLHAVQPASKHIKHLTPLGAKEFVSYHVLKKTKAVIKKEGFFENPYIVSRWSKISGETYGRSPGMKALADIKMVNKMKKAVIEAAQLAVAPPLQAPDDGVLLPIRTAPRSVNFYRAGTKDRIEPLNTGGNVALGEDLISQVHSKIEQAFYLDQLQIREADRMTATEVIQRRDEQLRTLGPILGRQHHELLKPLVERVYKILERRGKIPKPPASVIGQKVEVKYTSQIAKAQMSAEGDQLVKAMQLISPFIELDPGMMDNIDSDAIVRFAAGIYGLPHEILRDKKDVKSLRNSRAQAQEQESQLQNAQVEADIAQKLSGVQGQ